MATLRDVAPVELADGEFSDTLAASFLDETVVGSYRTFDAPAWSRYESKPFPGPHKYVLYWWALANGMAVGFNDNPTRGSSFPVVRVK